VRAVAVSSNGQSAISGSFDTSAIVWSLASDNAVLRFHDGAVNAVAFLRDGPMATAGEDARVAIWCPGGDAPVKVLEGHRVPIVALGIAHKSVLREDPTLVGVMLSEMFGMVAAMVARSNTWPGIQ